MNILKQIIDENRIDVDKLDFKWFIVKANDVSGRKDKNGKIIEHWNLFFGDPRVTVPLLSLHSADLINATDTIYNKREKTWKKYIEAMHSANTADPYYEVGSLHKLDGSLKELASSLADFKDKTGFDVTKLEVFDLDDKKTVSKVCA